MQGRKNALVVVLAIVLCCVIYIAVDCVRLATVEPGAKPLITISTYEEADKIEYKGLGYSVCYSYDYCINVEEDSSPEKRIYGMNIWLFDKILLWGWIT